jgi:hypothetical protein
VGILAGPASGRDWQQDDKPFMDTMNVKSEHPAAGPRTGSAVFERAAVATLLLVFLILGALSVRGKTSTFDEPRHYRYGMNILDGDSDRFDDSKMPVSALNALPAKIATGLPEGALRDLLEGLFAARMVTLGIAALVATLVYSWARMRHGFIPALFSMALYVFDPNIIAHSQLVTTDLYALGTIALAFFCLWRFAHRRTPANGLLCALALGLSQIAKYSSLALYGLFFAALFLFDLPEIKSFWRQDRRKMAGWIVRRYLIYAAAGLIVSLLVINMGFLFNRTFTHFGDYQFRSRPFQALQTGLPILDGAPVPVPYPYLEGLDWVIQREQTGEGYGKIYLLGELRDGQGFKGYYLLVSLLKTPLASQILVAAALVIYFLDRNRRRDFMGHEIFLLLPVVFYAVYFNFFYNAQIGIRYYLVIFPFLYVLAGGLIAGWERFSKRRKILSLGMVAWLVVSVLAYYPYYLTYFNELVPDKTLTYRYLADSNLDWGQSKTELERYFRDHPEASQPPANPQSGHFAVSANRLVGITADPERFRWLRENFRPVGTVANYYFVFEISQAEIDRLCMSAVECGPMP